MNGHIFLLDRDVTKVKKIDPDAFEPAPNPEFCDQKGIFYVSGYALRMKDDEPGSCWFLEQGKCRIYDRRFSVCRIYPHMLRRNADETGLVRWRLFARMNEHGQYDQDIPENECLALAQKVKEYENAYLTHQISFLETIHEFFTVHNLRHDQERYAHQMRSYSRVNPPTIMVFHEGELQEHQLISKKAPGI
jgi:Fe-S-cluster containining protein